MENNWNSNYIKESSEYLESRIGLITKLKEIKDLIKENALLLATIRIEALLGDMER